MKSENDKLTDRRESQIATQLKNFVSQQPVLSTLCILLIEFGVVTTLIYYTISGPLIGPPPLIFLAFPGLPLLHVAIFLVNRKSPKHERKVLAKYTLTGQILFWSVVITCLLVF